jgi:hypothetical protein
MVNTPPLTDSFYSWNSGGAGGNRTSNDVEAPEVIDSTKREKR